MGNRKHYNLYFEALKLLLLKNAPYFFFLIFAENVTLLSRNIIKLIPLRVSTSKYKKVKQNESEVEKMWFLFFGIFCLGIV